MGTRREPFSQRTSCRQTFVELYLIKKNHGEEKNEKTIEKVKYQEQKMR